MQAILYFSYDIFDRETGYSMAGQKLSITYIFGAMWLEGIGWKSKRYSVCQKEKEK